MPGDDFMGWTEGMSPLFLDFSPRAGMATLSLHIFHRWGRGWEIGISSEDTFYGAPRQAHQSCNVRQEGIVSNLLIVVWVFCNWLLKAKSQI